MQADTRSLQEGERRSERRGVILLALKMEEKGACTPRCPWSPPKEPAPDDTMMFTLETHFGLLTL